ncbi:MAG: UDP-N-acetylglucosamine 1-carboxyvinyltransferase [Planctomycetota bacterium]|nr:MAG: UDP-N-acetylglucosamine 1-carboxyvinyltransferase [Planctomycetota bacterium]
MDAFVIRGGRPLVGQFRVNGAKNAALPLMAAALLTDQPVTLRDVPDLSDVRNMRTLLAELGCETQDPPTQFTPPPGRPSPPRTLTLRTTVGTPVHARYELVRTMRASVCVLGPLLARRGRARVAMPGGCAIGDRPIDLHLRGLAALGASVELDAGDAVLTAPRGPGGERRLVGARVYLGGRFGSTVLGTANVMAAATLARGRTLIECAACEPEIADLARLLTAMGARIDGAGTPRIVVDGVDRLGGADLTLVPDRIEAGTIMAAAAITGGRVTLTNCPIDALLAFTDILTAAGVTVEEEPGADLMRATCVVSRDTPLRPAHVTTQPHPGFPTDLQAQTMALLALARGNSVITERVFPQRFLHVAELTRMGARLDHEGPSVVVSGVDRLVGAPVMASDLRASAGLVLAGLAAQGETTVRRVYHLDRGYERLDAALASLGADIRRVRDGQPAAPPAVGDFAPVAAGA